MNHIQQFLIIIKTNFREKNAGLLCNRSSRQRDFNAYRHFTVFRVRIVLIVHVSHLLFKLTVTEYSIFSPLSLTCPLSSFFFFFFFAFPAISLGFTTFGWDFCVCDRFFNPTIKVVTFRLRGWCVLGVFLLPAFTRLGHERQDLLSPCDEMHVCTD